MLTETAAYFHQRSRVLPMPAKATTAPTLRDLFARQASETHLAGEALFWEGDPAGQVFEIVGGLVRIFRVLPDGRRAIMGFIYPGDVLGVSHHSLHAYTAEAVTDVKVRRFPRSRFFASVDDSETLRPQLFALLCDEMSAAQEQMLLLGRKSAEERVISFLLAVNRKSGVGHRIELSMSRLDIADCLGLTIETVSRTMTSLARRGLIGLEGRHEVILRKLGTLRKLSCGDDMDAGREAAAPRAAVWPH
jgi:CRP/FNR family transcriptional regulator